MPKMFLVCVKADYRWAEVYVGGRCFNKAGVEIQEGDLTEEIRNSPLLEVVETSAAEAMQDSAAKSGENLDDLHVATADQDVVAQPELPVATPAKRRHKVASDDADG